MRNYFKHFHVKELIRKKCGPIVYTLRKWKFSFSKSTCTELYFKACIKDESVTLNLMQKGTKRLILHGIIVQNTNSRNNRIPLLLTLNFKMEVFTH